MALGTPRVLYGVHSLTPYSRSTGLPYGILKVIGSANLALASSIKELFAGSNKYAWTAESGTIGASLTCKVKAYPGFLFQLFLGSAVTDTGADTSGAVSTLTNVNGSTCKSATIGIASVAVKTAQKTSLKFGRYVVKVLTSSTVGIYLLSDIDAGRGTDVVYTDDNLGLTLSTVTISSGAGVDIDSLGLTLTGGSGTIGMTVGDTATFEVKPPSSASTDIVVGASADSFTNFGADILAQKRSSGEMFEIRAHNVIGVGLPINLAEMAFSEPELKMSCQYDAALDRVFTIRNITPS